MRQIKLKDLHKHCCKLMKEGHGEKSLVLSDDNEGNGYHGCFLTPNQVFSKSTGLDAGAFV